MLWWIIAFFFNLTIIVLTVRYTYVDTQHVSARLSIWTNLKMFLYTRYRENMWIIIETMHLFSCLVKLFITAYITWSLNFLACHYITSMFIEIQNDGNTILKARPLPAFSTYLMADKEITGPNYTWKDGQLTFQFKRKILFVFLSLNV